jgi:hypothetical protein
MGFLKEKRSVYSNNYFCMGFSKKKGKKKKEKKGG